MNRFQPRLFRGTDHVADLIEADYDVLPLLSRFSLPLGFADKTISELCADSGIDPEVFLLTLNFILTGEIDRSRMERVSAVDVAKFLHNSHGYFLDYKFPHIRSGLITALDPAHADINPIIVKYFDDYMRQAREHFEHEETVLFPYIERLARGEKTEGYSADAFVRRHDHEVEVALSELKNIILRYYSTSVPYRMYDALVDIYNCEADLKEHSDVEDRLLVPLVKELEKQCR